MAHQEAHASHIGSFSPAAVRDPSPDDIDAIEIVKARAPEGLGFHFKVRASGALFRFEPARYPLQPRFWCFSIYHCLSAGSPDEAQPRWISDVQLTREELAAAVQAVRADFAGWLADASRRDLRRWVFAQPGRSTAAQGALHAKKAAIS
jgi:hypothetical protein